MRIEDLVSDMLPEEEREIKKGRTLWQRGKSGEPGRIVGVHVGEFRRKDGTTFPVEVSVGSIVHGGRRMILGLARDVSERRAIEKRLLRQAFYDPLTGLPNRALFLDRLERALTRAARAKYPVAVFFLDLDGFKAVNDNFGHEVGDRLLAAVAGRLGLRLRSEDTVARFGGDEFTVLPQNVGGPSEANDAADRILEDLHKPLRVEGPSIASRPASASPSASPPRRRARAACRAARTRRCTWPRSAAGRATRFTRGNPPAPTARPARSRPPGPPRRRPGPTRPSPKRCWSRAWPPPRARSRGERYPLERVCPPSALRAVTKRTSERRFTHRRASGCSLW